MGIKTGKPRGRPPGSRNKRTKEMMAGAERAAAAVSAVIPDAFEGDAHAFLMAVYKDPTYDLEKRLDAAKAAIRFEKPALTATKLEAEVVYSDVSADPVPSEAEWETQYGHA